ncbi:hypothetical protein N7603_07565 [Acholeplasma vituli]|uniref:Lipoprotein n=1 Tax=Paracholeplasma vituli TaxID=69473 RepID=A0ABT2PYT3_9MOLU|nr:hypothetical protein [Paracholeplasma vituli]MCU0105514.1 hypothetical protein [Paracholeplasma vituli]
MRKATKLFLLFLVVGLVFGLAACKEDTPEEVTDLSVLSGWTDGGDGVYTFNTNTATELNVSYNKATFPNASMRSVEITKDLSVYKKLVITAEGMGSMQVRLETKDGTPAKQVGLNITAIKGTFEWNLSQLSDFMKKVNRVVIIAAPGKEASTGLLKITALTFSPEIADGFIINDGFNNIQTNVNEYNGTDATFNFNQKYESNDEGVYEISYSGTNAVIDYDKAAGMEWSFMINRVQGDFTDFNYAVFIIQGATGHKVLAKPNEYNAIESSIWLDGSEQALVINLTSLTLEQKNAITDFKIFIAAGLAPAAGQITIKQAFMTADYEYEEPVFEVNEYNGTDATFSLGNWYDGGDKVYTITPSGNAFEVDYAKKGDWNFMYALVDGDFSGFSKLEFEMTGQLNKTILLKVESTAGNYEKQFTFDGTKQVFTIDLTQMTTAQLEALNKVVMFAVPGGMGSGEFTIHSVTFKSSDYVVDSPWTSNDPGVYTFNGSVVNYTKGVGQHWSYMINTFNAEKVAGLNKMVIVLKGTAGKSILLKPNDLGALEQTVSFTNADPVTVTVEAASFTKLLIFAEPNTESVSGSFEIVSITLSYVPSENDLSKPVLFNDKWVANLATVYTFDFQANKTVVNYTKVNGQSWEWFRVVFNAKDTQGYNTLTITLKGTTGKRVLVKPNDSSALEKFVTFENDQPVTLTFTADQFMSIYMFGSPDLAPDTASFEILEAYLSYSADLLETWVENDPNTYEVVTLGSLTRVNYTKSDTQEWIFLKSTVTAKELEGLNTVTLVLKGTAGKSVMVKVNNSVERTVTFDGTNPVTVEVQIEAGITGVIIFAEPGTKSVSGSFDIISAMVSNKAIAS